MKFPPVVLTIAGSDNSGGAGLQADLKTFTTLGAYGTTAVTCVVAEHPGRVLNITPLPAERVVDQIRLVLEAFPVMAIKTGLLYSEEIIQSVEMALEPLFQKNIPLVVDPVMVASSGKVLLQPSACAALEKLMQRAFLMTPNRDEAALLCGHPITDLKFLSVAAHELATKYPGVHILAKGGHLKTAQALDLLVFPDGREREYSTPRIPNVDPHGTGCTYSAAITVGLAQGLTLEEAVERGKRFITRALEKRFELGGYQLLNHLP